MLELDEGQLSRPVLRGRGGSNTSLLPGLSVDGSSQRGKVVGGSGAWRVARGGRTVASESEGREPTVLQKRQKEANLLVVLIIGILEFRTNERGIGQENEPIYERPVVKRGGADFVSQGSRTSPSPSASVDLAHLRPVRR